MQDVAREAGVSTSTVSKCLANKKDVSRQTREKVLNICQALGYRPNPLVSALMRVRRRGDKATPSGLTIAFVTAFPTASGWKQHPSPIFRQLFAGAKVRAEERDYSLEHFWLHQDGMSSQRFASMLQARGIRGALLAPIPRTQTSIDSSWEALSVVALGLTPSTRLFNRVSTDYYQGMQLALKHCFERGYKRPGLAVRKETNERMEFRWEAAYQLERYRRTDSRARNSTGTLPRPLLTDEWESDTLQHWLRKERPDCIIGPVLGKLGDILLGSGLRIPEDIGMVGLLVPQMGDRLSGIVQNGEQIGAIGIDQLISQIERNETGMPPVPITHTAPGSWNAGKTLRMTCP